MKKTMNCLQKKLLKPRLLCLGLAILISYGNITTSDAQESKQFKTYEEVDSILGKSTSKIGEISRTGVTNTMLVPIKVDGITELQTLYFSADGNIDTGSYGLPEYCVTASPTSGKIINFRACSLEDVGLPADSPQIIHKSQMFFGADSLRANDKYIEKENRLKDISHLVWMAFDRGGVPEDEETVALVKEYKKLLDQTDFPLSLIYNIAAAPEFFEWIEETLTAGSDGYWTAYP